MEFRTLFRARKTTIIAAGALIILSGILLVFIRGDFFLPDNTRYDGAGFSFEYPREYALTEHSRDSATISQREFRTTSPLIEISIYRNDPESPAPASYEAFIGQQARNLCGSDGGGESVVCSDPVAKRILTPKGYVGTELMLTLTRTNLQSGTTTVGSFGPVYAFDYGYGLSTTTPGVAYRALFVYPSLSAVLASTPVDILMTQIIGTIESPAIPIDPSFVNRAGVEPAAAPTPVAAPAQ